MLEPQDLTNPVDKRWLLGRHTGLQKGLDSEKESAILAFQI